MARRTALRSTAEAAIVTARMTLRGEEEGRKYVTAFFRTRPWDKVDVGGFVVKKGKQSCFDDSTATDKHAGVKCAMARKCLLFCS